MGTLLEPDDIREQLQSQLLLHYDLPEDTKVYHLKYSENFTYRLESEMTGEKYVLRVNRPGYHDLTELESELSWIRAVKRDTDIQTADVLPGKDGKFIQQLAFTGSTDKYVCSLFSFVEGIGIRGNVAYRPQIHVDAQPRKQLARLRQNFIFMRCHGTPTILCHGFTGTSRICLVIRRAGAIGAKIRH